MIVIVTVTHNDRGMAFEAMVVTSLVNRLGCVIADDSQYQFHSRRQKINLLDARERQLLQEQSEHLMTTLPVLASRKGWTIDPGTVIEIVQDESRRSKVYDILLFTDNNPEPLEVSIKTRDEVEDKSYRFNTNQYQFDSVNGYVARVVGDNPRGTWEEVLSARGMTVTGFLSGVVDTMVRAVSDENSHDHHLLGTLSSDRFIGDGGYLKTLTGGGVRWYPPRPDTVPVIPVVERTRTTTFVYDIVYPTESGPVIYRIDFRVKFKDGKSKKVRFSPNGAPANLAATVRILEIRDQEFEEIR